MRNLTATNSLIIEAKDHFPRMQAIGTIIDEAGTLVRDGGAFYLRRDMGGRFQLELQRTPVDLVEKRVRLRGTLVGPSLVNADGVAPD